jgi:type III secretion protein U
MVHARSALGLGAGLCDAAPAAQGVAMAKEQAGDQTEPPTPKRLQDARRDGDVHKSKDLSSTAIVLTWIIIGWMVMPMLSHHAKALFAQSLSLFKTPFDVALLQLGTSAFFALLWLTIPLLLATCFVILLVEFLQVGSVFAPKKMLPKMEHLNPVEGVKKIFRQENWVELFKSLAKAGILIGIIYLAVKSFLPAYISLVHGNPGIFGEAFWAGAMRIGIWTILAFVFISVLDAFYQRFSFMKNLKMSMRDIKQEVKQNEGDPMIKGQRRQMHQEFSQASQANAIRSANVVVTNPTHIAVAIRYDAEETELPMVIAKGEDYDAEEIKRIAAEAGVPILENVELARGLYEKVEIEDYISSEFFRAVAEVLRWAEQARDQQR